MQPSAADKADVIFDDVVNFRDFGGLPTQYGAVICKGLLFRSGHFGGASQDTRRALEQMAFNVVVDLRFQKEREEEPSLWPDPQRPHFYRVDGGAHSDGPHVAVLRAGDMSASSIDHFYMEFYRTIPFDPLYQPLFSKVLQDMALNGGPALIHCTVGKDRTGILAALIQHTLGAPMDAILGDYMETRKAEGLARLIPEIVQRLSSRLKREIPVEIAQRMLGVEQSYLLAAFDEMKARTGSVDGYLNTIGISEAEKALLQTHYVE